MLRIYRFTNFGICKNYRQVILLTSTIFVGEINETGKQYYKLLFCYFKL
jgi:hypothetical protein